MDNLPMFMTDRRPVPTASRARVEVRALVDGETVVAPWNDRGVVMSPTSSTVIQSDR